ncbi:FYVE, RhoGEF and PH domain-containing protein 6 [Larimichthys crocea]|uniref:Uncharacterized protein n=1 Tax=Larimichthys crocea TaxID=215358 RepID=A0ACD3QEH5_LARCR|nr:FYVE, RhoGEF and PH domain-containing protein 6 [Larimichthys crocea]
MSGYLQRSKANKKQGKRLWFVIKDKVLYTYAASEDVAALESQPLLGFVLKVDPLQKMQLKLYHKNTLYYIFKADDVQTAQRWIESVQRSHSALTLTINTFFFFFTSVLSEFCTKHLETPC